MGPVDSTESGGGKVLVQGGVSPAKRFWGGDIRGPPSQDVDRLRGGGTSEQHVQRRRREGGRAVTCRGPPECGRADVWSTPRHCGH